MAKEKSNEIVSEEAEMERRFKKLEEDSTETKDLVSRMAEKILDKPGPEPKPKTKPNGNPPPVEIGGVKKFFQGLGLLAAEPKE